MTHSRHHRFWLVIVTILLAIQFVQAQDSLNIRCLSRIPTTASRAVAVQGNFAYVCDDTVGLRVIDISDPLHPTQVACFDTPGEVANIKIVDNYAFVIDYGVGLKILNISNPYSITQIGSLTPPHFSGIDLAISGNYAYIADISNGMRIIDISNLSAPVQIALDTINCELWGIAVSGRYAYLADHLNGIRIFDVLNPVSPVMIDTSYLRTTYDIEISGNYAYIAGGGRWLSIADITNPSAPQQVECPNYNGSGYSVSVIGNYAYLTGSYLSHRSVRIFNISNPLSVYQVGFYNLPNISMGVAVSGNHLYVVERTNFGIYDISQALGVVDRISEAVPSTFALKPNFPNPFNPTTTIQYTIPKSSKVSLKIFDLNGREVASLVDFNQNPGEYSVKFDGKTLAAGTYFARLEAGSFVQMQKLVLLK